ncbi:MAG: GDP-mannose 4,6-dehydratase [Rhodospirillaceae bacterium]|nr:GDP-mannose 4,6-dehydratase [Rhodospirillaceae bacterium]
MPRIAGGTFLITGGASLVGSYIADALLAQGAKEIRLLDTLALGSTEMVGHLLNDTRVKLIRGDVTQLDDVVNAATGADGVFALAAFLTISMAQNPALGVTINNMGIVNTVEACRIAKVKRIIFASSVGAYGLPTADVITEETPFTSAGASPAFVLYSASKLTGEALCAHYQKAHGVEFNALRISSVYGARQHNRAVNANFILQVHDRIRRGEAPVILGDGKEVHDYIYVSDVADAAAIAMSSPSHGHVLNIATGIDTNLTRVTEIVLEVCNARHLKPLYRADDRAVKASTVTHLNFSRAKAEKTIGWTPKISIEDGLRRTIAWRDSRGKS